MSMESGRPRAREEERERASEHHLFLPAALQDATRIYGDSLSLSFPGQNGKALLIVGEGGDASPACLPACLTACLPASLPTYRRFVAGAALSTWPSISPITDSRQGDPPSVLTDRRAAARARQPLNSAFALRDRVVGRTVESVNSWHYCHQGSLGENAPSFR